MTHRQHLGDVLGMGRQGRYGLEGSPQVVEIEPGDDDLLSGRGQLLGGVDESPVEELALVDPDYDRSVLDLT